MSTKEETNKCGKCEKTVYPMEEIISAGHKWHRWCFKCMGEVEEGKVCGITLTIKEVNEFEGKIFCGKHVPKPLLHSVTDDVMTEHIRHAPHKGAEGLGHVGLLHKDARAQDSLHKEAVKSAEFNV
eukprot:gb/GEZN01015996.1/.p1 GENE.gb/GEZN01015996.1/~~gb/GEZN01015996.1/.p1  ORF type:complete len:126 (-),score=13.12 gb/GEZN01015996.1/:352-729(-)